MCGNFLKDKVNLEVTRDKELSECWFVGVFYLGRNYSVEMPVSSHVFF